MELFDRVFAVVARFDFGVVEGGKAAHHVFYNGLIQCAYFILQCSIIIVNGIMCSF